MRVEHESSESINQANVSPWSAVNVITGTVTGCLIAIMTVTIAWNYIPGPYLTVWLATVGISFVIGINQAFLFQKTKQGFFKNNTSILTASIFFGMLWAIPGFFLVTISQVTNLAMYALTIMLMFAWASIYFSRIKFQFLAFCIPLTIPLVLQIMYQGTGAVVLAGIMTTSLLILTACTKTTQDAVQNGINSLVQSLQKIRKQLKRQRSEQQNEITAAGENELQLRELVDATFEGIIVHERGKIIDTNKTLVNMIGINRDEAIGMDIYELISEDSQDVLSRRLRDKFTECFEVSALRADGSTLPVEIRTATYNFRNKLINILVLRDITDRKKAEKNIIKLASVDALTGLPNRNQLKDSIRNFINRARSRQNKFAFMIVDIDNFKLINESLGHEVGDELLKYVSKKISETVRGHDILARWGDDEFAILLDKIENDEEITFVTRRIKKVLGQFIEFNGHEIFVSASIGCTTYPNDSRSPEGLIGNAEVAVRRAKEKGHNNIFYYVKDFDSATTERYELENNLRKAIKNKEFELHYQPKINLSSCEVTGVEALIRWRHPEKGLIAPNEFITLAEETGLIVPIGNWVLEEACRQINTWQNTGLAPVPIAINLSLRQLKDANMLDVIMTTLARYNVSPELLEIEITESSVAENYEKAIDMMNVLSTAGVCISIDDFGTGYSSLSYLKRFPVDYLKIDRSFISCIPDNADDTAITSTIIAMAENLGLKVIAEGVETQEQLNFIQEKGCYSAQGFLISKPLSEKYITQWLINPPSNYGGQKSIKRKSLH